MSHRTRSRRRWRVPRALALAFVVLGVPISGSAAAEGQVDGYTCGPPARNNPPPLVQPRTACDGSAARVQSTGGAAQAQSDEGDGADAGIVAGGGALLALITVGGVLVAFRRRGRQPTRPVTEHREELFT